MRNEREHKEQKTFFRWIALIGEKRFPGLGLAFAIPNGGQRHIKVAAKLKAEGVKKGVPDLMIPVARSIAGIQYHGCFLEAKATKASKPTESQKAYIQALKEQGYFAIVAHGADELIYTAVYYMTGGDMKLADEYVKGMI